MLWPEFRNPSCHRVADVVRGPHRPPKVIGPMILRAPLSLDHQVKNWSKQLWASARASPRPHDIRYSLQVRMWLNRRLIARASVRCRCYHELRNPLHLSKLLRVSEEVQDAVSSGKPVVALESTIYTHGKLLLGIACSSLPSAYLSFQAFHIRKMLHLQPAWSQSSGLQVRYQRVSVCLTALLELVWEKKI